MSGIIKEKETFFTLVPRAREFARREGKFSEKKLASALGVHRPTAAKLICALLVTGDIEQTKGDKFLFTDGGGGRNDAGADAFTHDYLPLVEDEKAFRAIGHEGYMTGTLLPAVKTGILYGSLSVIFLQRKLSVAYERAHEIFDIIAACGLLGEEDDRNPGRRKMAFGFADYDALCARLGVTE